MLGGSLLKQNILAYCALESFKPGAQNYLNIYYLNMKILLLMGVPPWQVFEALHKQEQIKPTAQIWI